MTIGEAIVELKREFVGEYYSQIEAKKIAVKALKKRCAIKPDVSKEKTSSRLIFRCKCGHNVGYWRHNKLIKSFFCAYCGQAIDWREYEDLD